MTDRDADLLRRIEALEAENRRIRTSPRRWAAGFAVAAGTFVAVSGGCMQSDAQGAANNKRLAALEAVDVAERLSAVEKQVAGVAARELKLPDHIVARSIAIRDDRGTERLRLDSDNGIVAMDANGSAGAKYHDGGVSIIGDNGRPRVLIHSGGILLDDETGKARVRVSERLGLTFDENGRTLVMVGAYGLGVHDENGKQRIVVGRADHVNTRTGANTTFPAAFVLYGEDEKVLWMAPRE